MQAANRVVLNTGALYGRMLITMFISLYSTRLVLNSLGAQDYGIFNLIGGVIAMLSFLNMAMSLSTQRYLSFYLGGGDREKLKMVFNSSLLLHLALGAALVILFEAAGAPLFDHVLNIPADRMPTARIIFHFMVISAFFTIISVPYDATLNAQENMVLVAGLGIFEAVAKLAIALSLQYLLSDKLVVYSALSASLAIVLLVFKRIYCTVRYEESRMRIRRYFDKGLLKEMFTYAWWNMFGASSVVAKSQGLAMILNVFFGTIVNAAYGVASQVNAQLSFFSVTMLRALNPQIIKSEGSGNRPRMLRLSMVASKFSFFLLSFVSIPVMIEMPFILQCWLKQVPQYTVMFCRLIIVVSLINQLTTGIQVAVQSVGKIKVYQVIVSTLVLLNLPVAYVLLKLGYPPYSVLAGAIVMECITCGYRIAAAHIITGMGIRDFLTNVVLAGIAPIALSALVALLPQLALEEGWIRLLLTGGVSAFAVIASIKLIGLTAYEKDKLETILGKVISKLQTRLAVVKAN